jgi:hypothetical protein
VLGLFSGICALGLLAAAHALLHRAAGPEQAFLGWISQSPLPGAEQFLLAWSGCILGGLGGLVSLGSSEHWG